MIEELLLNAGLEKGIFAVLFIWLFYTERKSSQEREAKLTDFLEGMRDEFAKLVGSYERLTDDVSDIKARLDREEKQDSGGK